MKLYKSIITAIFLIMFAGQAALGCACTIENTADHNDMAHERMNHHSAKMSHDMDDCDHGCSLSAISTDDVKFAINTEIKKIKLKPIKVFMAVASFSFSPPLNQIFDRHRFKPHPHPFKANNSLLTQATLLRI